MSNLPEQRKKWLIPRSHLFTAGFQQSIWKNKVSLGFEVEIYSTRRAIWNLKSLYKVVLLKLNYDLIGLVMNLQGER